MKFSSLKKILLTAVLAFCLVITTSCGALTYLGPLYAVLPDSTPADVATLSATEVTTEVISLTEAPSFTTKPTSLPDATITVAPTAKPIIVPTEAPEKIPAYEGIPYTVLNRNVPQFSQELKTNTRSFENYSAQDRLGRCGVAFANISREIMPEDDRESIGQIKPAGWHLVKYDFIDGKYLYNRCHLIGFQLAGENANEKNLITGTRYLNVKGMLPFENEVADYAEDTGNHVLYRVTPHYTGDNLIADGVQIEAYSVEDGGKGICFNVYCYNVQPGVIIDYRTGESKAAETQSETLVPTATPTIAPTPTATPEAAPEDGDSYSYVLNTSTKKFHYHDCYSVEKIAEKNYREYYGTREELIKEGYSPCGNCDP